MSLVELRELRFGSLALRFAVAHAGPAAARLGLPKGVPESAQFKPEGQRIVLRYGAAEHTLDTTALGGLLVAYCVRARIPLPRSAAKSARVTTDSAVLVTRLTHELPPEPVEAPAASPAAPEAPRQMVWRR